MRTVLAACSLLLGSLALVGQEKLAPAKADTASVEQTLIQMERDWNQASLTKDYKTLDRILADDGTAIDFRGMTVTKAESIAELKSGESSNQSVELGEMKVRVFGNTAIVVGSDTEKSTYHGKDSSGRYAWMDVFVKAQRPVASGGVGEHQDREVACGDGMVGGRRLELRTSCL